jgi:hypothetical protein
MTYPVQIKLLGTAGVGVSMGVDRIYAGGVGFATPGL